MSLATLEKTPHHIGVDPGQSGAIAILDQNGECVLLEDYPGDEVALSNLFAELPEGIIYHAAIEKSGAMPKQGVASMFKFGMNYGIWLGILAAYGVSVKIVKPQEWQKGMLHKVDGKDTKARSLTTARRMFPDQTEKLKFKKDHHRADALLIAYYKLKGDR